MEEYLELAKLGIDVFPGYYNFVHYYPNLKSLQLNIDTNLIKFIDNENRDLSLYFHIPYCFTKCKFCYYNTNTNVNSDLLMDYINKLILEIEKYSDVLKGKKIKTIYIGGGTPSYLPENIIEKLLKYLDKKFNFSNIEEITFEGEPVSISTKYNTLIDLGVTRVSFGIQSLDNRVLEYHNRFHNSSDAKNAVELLLRSKVKTFNVDFIYGLKGQSIEDVRNIINFIDEVQPPSVTFYQLWYAAHTIKKIDWKDKLESIQAINEMKHLIYDSLTKYYKINNINWFVKNEKDKCKHYNYTWKNNPYLGFGLSSYSYVKGLAFKNPSSFKDYNDFASNSKRIIYKAKRLSNNEIALREILLGLKTDHGINLTEIFTKYDVYLPNVERDLISLTKLNYLKHTNSFYSFTLKGVFWGDSILNHFINLKL